MEYFINHISYPYSVKKSRSFLSLGFAIFLVFSITSNHSVPEAYACSCIAPDTPTNEMKKFDAVFSGKVVKMDPKHPTEPVYSSADPVFVTFDVDMVWKGLDDIDTVTIHTAQSSASCGFEFVDGLEYIVYATQNEEQLDVSLCSRTALMSNASEDLDELGMGLFSGTSIGPIMSPLKQLQSGVAVDEVQCRKSFTLVMKYDDSPVCVKENSVPKLVERGFLQ